MKLISYLNPFTLIRWAFVGKRLHEIIDFDQKRTELETFFNRTQVTVQKKVVRMERLAAQNQVHTDHIEKAKMLADNLKILMTQTLGSAPAPVVQADPEAQ